MTTLPNLLYRKLIRPTSSDPDGRRREFILNTLLLGLLIVATLALLLSSYNYFIAHVSLRPAAMQQTLLFWAVIATLLIVSRRGKSSIAAVSLVIILLTGSTLFALTWGFTLATAELFFTLTIVVAGVLFRAPLALAAAGIVTLSLIGVTIAQVNGWQSPSLDWRNEPPRWVDVVGYVAIFIIIGIVSWLSNRETDRSLKRARRSEAELQKERDNLEAKVIERTHELEELQLARLLEMQPFAEFGRIGASLVHDIANPLTAATLHVEELNRQQHSVLVHQVKRNLLHLERYLDAARKQIKRESDLRVFSVGAELKQVAHLLTHRARKVGVRIIVDKVPSIKLYGDVVKFNQLVANLIVNALEASEKSRNPERAEVRVHVAARGNQAVITITDFGNGIAPQDLTRLFEPFYSTKVSERSGLGLGLSLVKQYVEHDFRGKVSAAMSKEGGTVFTVQLKGQKKP